MTITSTKLVDDNFKIMVNANGVGSEEDQKIVDVEASNNASSEPKVSIANLQYEILGTGNVTLFFEKRSSIDSKNSYLCRFGKDSIVQSQNCVRFGKRTILYNR